MEAFGSILFQIAVMFLLILCGMFLYRIGWISGQMNKQLSKLVISFVNPAVMFYAYNMEFKAALLTGLLQAFAVAFVMHLLFIGASRIFLGKGNTEEIGLERYCCIYSNCAFIGIPLVSAVYGAEGVFYITAYITVFNLLMWSHGISLLEKEKGGNFLRKILLSPTIIATLLGMIVFFAQIPLPKLILEPVRYIADLNTPLAMIVSGVTIAQSGFLDAWKDKRIYRIAFIKLLLVPAAMFGVFLLCNRNRTAFLSTILVGGCPTATASSMLAIQYGRDEKYASRIFGVTTILSAFTLPLLVGLGEILK